MALPVQPALPADAPSLAEGRFVLTTRLGIGRCTATFRAYDRKQRAWRAVKVLLPQQASDPSFVDAFAAGGLALSAVVHPNLVRVYEIGAGSDSAPFLVLELVTGGNLGAWIKRHGPMSSGAACGAVFEVARGLAALHESGIEHGAVWPRNVHVAQTGVRKLSDPSIDTTTGDLSNDVVGLGALLDALIGGGIDPRVVDIVANCGGTLRSPDAVADALEQVLSSLTPEPVGGPNPLIDLGGYEETLSTSLLPEELEGLCDQHGGAPHRAPPMSATPMPPMSATPMPAMPASDLPDWAEVATPEPAREELLISVPSTLTRTQGPPSTQGPEMSASGGPPELRFPTPDPLPPTPERKSKAAPQPVAAAAMSSDSEPGERGNRGPGCMTLVVVPAVLAVAVALLFVAGVTYVFGMASLDIVRASNDANAGRKQLYKVLDKEKDLVATLVEASPDRQSLIDAHYAFGERHNEPLREAEALHLAKEIGAAADAIDKVQLERLNLVHEVRRVRTAHLEYEASVAAWSAAATTSQGSLVVSLGLAMPPPTLPPPH